MPQPNGYRKAMRFMRHANKFGLPIVTFVDTPGAYAGRAAEELGQVRVGVGWSGWCASRNAASAAAGSRRLCVCPPPSTHLRHYPPTHQLPSNTQGEAIAYNLREMFGLRVPVISVVIGEASPLDCSTHKDWPRGWIEGCCSSRPAWLVSCWSPTPAHPPSSSAPSCPQGGSGGALAIGCANKNLIMENSVYYVASPEACAAILWKSRSAAGQVGVGVKDRVAWQQCVTALRVQGWV
jgi:hypothetical protein